MVSNPSKELCCVIFDISIYSSSISTKRSIQRTPFKDQGGRNMMRNLRLERRNTGANAFPWQEANELSLSFKKPQVTAFHSLANWKNHFEASKQSNKLIVIDFTASWCGPCRYIEPAINEFAARYTDVDFVKIDVDELDGVAEEYEVEAMPTLILLKKGKVVDKVVGAKKEELQKKIEKHRV